MSFIDRAKSFFGVGDIIPTIASATVLPITATQTTFYVSGTTQVESLSLVKRLPGRVIVLIGVTTTGPVLKTNASTTTEGQMDLGASDITLAPTDVVFLMHQNNGTWLRISSSDN